MRPGANVTKVRLVHASVRQLHKKSGVWDYDTYGEPVSQKYTAGTICVFSVQVLETMRNLGITVSNDDAHGFMCAWHYVNHYLGQVRGHDGAAANTPRPAVSAPSAALTQRVGEQGGEVVLLADPRDPVRSWEAVRRGTDGGSSTPWTTCSA
ncbi:oxygenase MpaB family protein [Streptomyces sp. NPDC096046]|uniref:oxygenase MpaB family protein n=1 Tax=Streptomyces sp. NPDC096046 TaxID=3155542 RepID=UPI00332E2A90